MESVEEAKGAVGKDCWVIRAYFALASEGGLRLAGRRRSKGPFVRGRGMDARHEENFGLERFFVFFSSFSFPQKGPGEPGRSGNRGKVKGRFADLGWEKQPGLGSSVERPGEARRQDRAQRSPDPPFPELPRPPHSGPAPLGGPAPSSGSD